MSSVEAAERRRRTLALSLAEGVGPVRYRQLVERHGSAAAALDAALTGERRRAALTAADEAIAAAAACGAAVWLPSDPEYPAALLDLSDPPARLFGLGAAAAARRPAVSIVGTRESSAYGESVATELARALAEAGAAVVSGMARGIDAAAHRAALACGGRTVAVLGTGVDVPYPVSHRGLHAEIASAGLVLSEELPGARPGPGSFPRRNRIIAALSDVTIVVEAGVKSGALITAGAALELGRAVAAVPGPMHAAASRGTNELLRDGAAVITSVDDALALLSLPRGDERASERVAEGAAALGPAAGAVWEALARGPLDPDALSERAGLAARECLTGVTALELAGLVSVEPSGRLRRL